jgi:hypothetical protein
VKKNDAAHRLPRGMLLLEKNHNTTSYKMPELHSEENNDIECRLASLVLLLEKSGNTTSYNMPELHGEEIMMQHTTCQVACFC